MLLLDTHIFLWYITADPKLPAPFRVAIQDTANEVFLSAASVWEAVIKHGLGKLPLPGAPAEYLPQQRAAHGISALPVDEGAMAHLASLAPIHQDPFDRLLVCSGDSTRTDDRDCRSRHCRLLGDAASKGLTAPGAVGPPCARPRPRTRRGRAGGLFREDPRPGSYQGCRTTATAVAGHGLDVRMYGRILSGTGMRWL